MTNEEINKAIEYVAALMRGAGDRLNLEVEHGYKSEVGEHGWVVEEPDGSFSVTISATPDE